MHDYIPRQTRASAGLSVTFTFVNCIQLRINQHLMTSNRIATAVFSIAAIVLSQIWNPAYAQCTFSLTGSQWVATCDLPNGAIETDVSGGTDPYVYQWSNTATTEDLFDVNAGTYCVTVSDAAGCTATGCYVISQIGG